MSKKVYLYYSLLKNAWSVWTICAKNAHRRAIYLYLFPGILKSHPCRHPISDRSWFTWSSIRLHNLILATLRLSRVYASYTFAVVLPMMPMSSAKPRNWKDRWRIVPRMSLSSSAPRMTPYRAMLKSKQERPSPCLRPLWDWNDSDVKYYTLTLHCTPFLVAANSRINFPGKWYRCMIFHSSFRSMVHGHRLEVDEHLALSTLLKDRPKSENLV